MFIVKKIGKYKCMELSSAVRGCGHTYFGFHIEWSRNCSHAGFTSYFEIWNWIFEFNVCDIRHWDSDNDCFEDLSKIEDPKYADEYEEEYECADNDNWEDQIGI